MLSLLLSDSRGADLPPFEPGAHVDLHLADGTVRQYSLCGDPADRKTYRVAVREVEGGKASRAIHRELRPGALMTVGGPRNHFAFAAAARYLFVAGGIGITPLLPMMRAASAAGRPWTLFYCTRSAEVAPFLGEALRLGGEIRLHASEAGERLDVAATLAEPQADTLVYCCGPAGLMEAVERATARWPEAAVRFEWFKPRALAAGAPPPGSFELVLARAGLTLTVPPDRSILEVLVDHGLDPPRSCEQGVCGSCECKVLEGEVDHRDSLLSPADRAANEVMMVCVSRAKGPRLVLDV